MGVKILPFLAADAAIPDTKVEVSYLLFQNVVKIKKRVSGGDN